MAPPRLSLLLLAYNQRDTVEAAVKSCLAQRGPPIEIVLSDDASVDGSFETMQAMAAAYHGPHRVRVHRSAVNLGIGAHLNKLVASSSGELLVIAAGDDESLPERCETLAATWDAADRRPDLLACPLLDMDADGATHATTGVDDLAQWDLARWLRRRPHVVGAGHAWTRRCFERFGGFGDGIAYEDQIMCFRAMLGGGAITLAEPLVKYRRGGISAKHLPQTADGVRERMRIQNRRHLAEVEQLSLDAHTAGMGALVDPALAPERERQQCLRDLLASATWARTWAVLRAWPAVPLAWRWHKALEVRLAALKASSYRRRRAA